jgi:hypothetical protein
MATISGYITKEKAIKLLDVLIKYAESDSLETRFITPDETNALKQAQNVLRWSTYDELLPPFNGKC